MTTSPSNAKESESLQPQTRLEQLHLSVKTVEVHRQHIKEKLKLTDAPSLARYAVQWIDSQGV